MDRAFEILGRGETPLLLTCEHASARLPSPLESSGDDRPWMQTHWAWDLGAEALCRELSERLGGRAVAARFSRLVCDANRPCEHPDWIRESVEGHALSFNRGLTSGERARRRETCWVPYHRAIDEQLRAERPALMVAMHSFTPVWKGRGRPMEIGVLYDDHEPLALALADALSRAGSTVALNAPYSGFDGLMYAASRHGKAHKVPYLELEIRQDRLADPAGIAQLGQRIAGALAGLLD